ncbi:hypothetical protein Grass_87 [Bacillus phage Grass]|uniref:Uncharacterized protein n=1 Tax=Bacillus phage Grass TaxID=1406785 RepID=U5PXP0_BPGRA|nr:hypothetical protein Grass_87 [Bacillus phage Grass]AGY47352.1 hypothetical protein Grass_87 [Bacillus phage Grass]UPI12849.1 hypothetical protein [Bacillus phage SBSphiJ5]
MSNDRKENVEKVENSGNPVNYNYVLQEYQQTISQLTSELVYLKARVRTLEDELQESNDSEEKTEHRLKK